MRGFDGARVTVMGLGRFGGGVGVARWLADQGADVLVTDLEPENRLHASVPALSGLIQAGQVRLRLGEHNVSDFTTCHLVVANPAVPTPWDNRFLRAARAAGVPVTTEITLLAERLPARERVIGVTGTVGKSTTAAMIAAGLRAAGRPVALGGNIGGSLLADLDALDPTSWIVLELSSAMLHWLAEARWSPGFAAVTGFAPNHADWHGTVDHYEASKRNILAFQRPGDTCILGPSVHGWASAPGVRRTLVDASARVAGLRVPGAHNAANAAVALAACAAAGADRDACERGIRAFEGLPHRLQAVCEASVPGGVIRFFNDSKATTPEATLVAIDAVRTLGPVHLIAGGYDKGIDLSPVARIAHGLAGLYTIGATGDALARAAPGNAESCGTLDAAVARAFERARPGDTVLLSPGCASWDQFENYERRGEAFCRLVRERAEATRCAHSPG